MFLVKNNSGMSLVGVLMAAGLTAGIALVIAKLGENSNNVQIATKANMAINNTTNNIERLLLKGEHCKSILDQATIPVNTPVLIPSIRLEKTIPPGTYKTLYTIGEYPAVNSMIKGSNVFFKSLTAFRSSTTPNIVELTALYEKHGKALSAKVISKSFTLEAKFTGNSVTKCFSQLENAVETACKSIDPNATFSGTDCILSSGFKTNLVMDIINPLKRKLYETDSGIITRNQTYTYTDRTCSKCKKSGCTPPACPAGYVKHGSRSCSKGGTCGFKPRWRNCKQTCKKAKPAIGNYISL